MTPRFMLREAWPWEYSEWRTSIVSLPLTGRRGLSTGSKGFRCMVDVRGHSSFWKYEGLWEEQV